MNIEELPKTVWIGEAYESTQHGNDTRVERVVHLTEADAHEDIRTLAESLTVDYIVVEEERLFAGQVDSMEEL